MTATHQPASRGLEGSRERDASTATRSRSRAAPAKAGPDGEPGRTPAGAGHRADGGSERPGPASILSRLPPVSRPDDPLEREAEAVADRIVAGRPAGPIDSTAAGRPDDQPPTARLEDDEEERPREQVAGSATGRPVVQRLAESPGRTTNVTSIVHSPGPGSAIPPTVRSRLEPGLGVDLGGVRVHTGARAAEAATAINARAFTFGRDIFLNRGESPNDLSVMAHEATHTVQQGGAEAGRASALRLPGTAIGPDRQTEEELQALPGWLTDKIAEYARYVPGYTLFTVLIEYNPITGRTVPRTARNFVQGLLELVPFGPLIYDKLDELGVIESAMSFIERQLTTFDISLARVERLINEAWDRMDFIRWDPFDYNLGVLRDVFGPLWEDVKGFAASVVDEVVALIRSAAAEFADGLLGDNRAWALIKKVLHYDPIRGERVEATTVEILEDFLLLIGRETELEQMREKGTLQETADWIDTQIATFLDLLAAFGSLISAAWDAIQPANLPNLFANLETLTTRLGELLVRVWDFASTVALKVLELVKDALLGLLSDFVHYVPGFHLVTVLLGRNPFTGEEVPRTAENVIKGFISLLPGGIVVYEKLAETGVVAEAGAAIDGAVNELGISWSMITGLFRGIWDSLSIGDLVDPVGAFTRIRDQFGEPISRLFRFIGVVVREVIGLILALMNFPTELVMRILANAMEAIDNIMADPIGFLLNMLRAVKAGFLNFLDNIFEHLLNGLLDWLFRGLRDAGIEPPTELTLESALDLTLQILDLSVERLWAKLAERFGQERVDQIRGGIDRLVGIWEFVRDVQQRGLSAIWEYIESQLSNLWDVIIEQARNWIMTQIVSKVTAKLLTMLDPTGIMAVVNSFIAFFNAVQSVVEYIRDILEIIDRYVATMAAIARGDIEPGAAELEGGLAAAIPVAIGFLANQVGLGDIGAKVAEIVGGLRDLVDRALDWLLDQAERALTAVLNALGFGADDEDGADGPESELGDVRDLVRAELAQELTTEHSEDELDEILAAKLAQHRDAGLTALYLQPREDGGFTVVAEASPPENLLELIPRVGGRPSVRTLVRIRLAGEEPAFEGTESVEVEFAPSTAEWQAWVREHHGTTSDPAEFRRWQREAIAALTQTRTVEIPAGSGVDPAVEAMRARARTLGDGTRVPGGDYRLVGRFDETNRSRHVGAIMDRGESNIIDAQFWSTGSLLHGERNNNATHAEVQFMSWYRGLPGATRARVVEIQLQNDDYSPCWTCSRQLVAFLREAQAAADQPIDAFITWGEAYLRTSQFERSGGETLPSSLAGLRSGRWTATGPYPDMSDVDPRFATR